MPIQKTVKQFPFIWLIQWEFGGKEVMMQEEMQNI